MDQFSIVMIEKGCYEPSLVYITKVSLAMLVGETLPNFYGG
jgi:DNA-binding XRE family transcriptional regulator